MHASMSMCQINSQWMAVLCESTQEVLQFVWTVQLPNACPHFLLSISAAALCISSLPVSQHILSTYFVSNAKEILKEEEKKHSKLKRFCS